MFSLYTFGQQKTNFRILLPVARLEKSKQSFIYNSCVIWNSLVQNILEKSLPNVKNIVVQGSSKNSDFCATVPFIKNKLKLEMLRLQALGDKSTWVTENVLQ